MPTIAKMTMPSMTKTASGIQDLGSIPGEQEELLVYIEVTAVSGTSPGLTMTYQCSSDGVSFWDHTAGAPIQAAGKQLLKVPDTIGKFGRLSYAITGVAPSFTFSAIAEAKRA
jgi:hypothetical protein